jgi:wyosine [tRNA(Phe)-imidazoG37] synthetase (radical SAM superfamily)
MINTKTLELIIKSIVKSQYSIVGPLAIEQANKVSGITVNTTGEPSLDAKIDDPVKLLSDLVKQFERLFGAASVEVCKEAVKEAHVTITEKDLPDILR